ncbi:unnamed protein product, partial [Adineta ricciae]
MLFLVWLLSLLWMETGCDMEFYLSSHLQYDCLHFYSMSSVTPIKNEYCIRPVDDIDMVFTRDLVNMHDNNYTFDKLSNMNVTAHDVFFWSISINVAEKYQHYLAEKDKSQLSNEIFFNCTTSWFGPRCQYSFDIPETYPLINVDSSYTLTDSTCYVLLECDRGGLFLCLDWREICDGRIDCVNNGVDESNCFDLEMNECESDEYRCHNGLCIPDYYW